MTDHRHAGRGMTAARFRPGTKTRGARGQTGPRVTIAKKGARRHLPEAGYSPDFQTERHSNQTGQVPRRLLLNLEPHIHLSKSRPVEIHGIAINRNET